MPEDKAICRTCSAQAGDKSIFVHTGLTVKDSKPEGFIHLSHGHELRAQFTPDEARQHALTIMECAEAAEMDVIVYQFFREKLGIDDSRAGQIIAELRHFRTYREPNDK